MVTPMFLENEGVGETNSIYEKVAEKWSPFHLTQNPGASLLDRFLGPHNSRPVSLPSHCRFFHYSILHVFPLPYFLVMATYFNSMTSILELDSL